MSETEILEDYPALEQNDIRACLETASKLPKVESIHKGVAD